MTNVLAAGQRVGVGHQVILSIVGVDQVLGRITLAAQQDNRTVITDDKAGMFADVIGDVLIAGPDAHLAPTH